MVVVPLVFAFGALDSLSNNVSAYFRLKLTGVSVHQLQKTLILRTTTIIHQTSVSIVPVELEHIIAICVAMYVTVNFEIIIIAPLVKAVILSPAHLLRRVLRLPEYLFILHFPVHVCMLW